MFNSKLKNRVDKKEVYNKPNAFKEDNALIYPKEGYSDVVKILLDKSSIKVSFKD